MSLYGDAASLEQSGNPLINNSEVLITAQRLRSEANAALYELDEHEAISMVFLLLDVEQLARHGFNYCQFICNGRTKETMDKVVNIVQGTTGHVVSVIEGLYIVGRYDLLEDRLGLCVDQNFCTVFSGEIDRVKKALYCVFAGMAQEEADRIVRSRLPDWFCPEPGRPLEETFARKLRIDNYYQMIAELFNALVEENQETLALYIQPFARTPQVLPVPRQASWNEKDFYPGPSCYPHGLCIIINVKSFMKPRDVHDNIPLAERHGSDIDKQRLTGTFKLFGFHVMHFDNPDYEMIQRYFRDLRTNPKLTLISCLAVCIMTHGDENDQIYLHDRTCISMTDMRKLCFSQALLNKPRLYFVQACRGERALQPIFLQRDDCTVTHMESDCIISAATVKGYSAVRSQTEGSWYITDLCQALQEYGHKSTIKCVLQKTRESLRARVGSMNNTYVTQLSEDKVTTVKDVQLVRADETNFIEGIIDLVQLEVVEKLVEDQLEAALDLVEREGLLENIMDRFADIRIAQKTF